MQHDALRRDASDLGVEAITKLDEGVAVGHVEPPVRKSKNGLGAGTLSPGHVTRQRARSTKPRAYEATRLRGSGD